MCVYTHEGPPGAQPPPVPLRGRQASSWDMPGQAGSPGSTQGLWGDQAWRGSRALCCCRQEPGSVPSNRSRVGVGRGSKGPHISASLGVGDGTEAGSVAMETEGSSGKAEGNGQSGWDRVNWRWHENAPNPGTGGTRGQVAEPQAVPRPPTRPGPLPARCTYLGRRSGGGEGSGRQPPALRARAGPGLRSWRPPPAPARPRALRVQQASAGGCRCEEP